MEASCKDEVLLHKRFGLLSFLPMQVLSDSKLAVLCTLVFVLIPYSVLSPGSGTSPVMILYMYRMMKHSLHHSRLYIFKCFSLHNLLCKWASEDSYHRFEMLRICL